MREFTVSIPITGVVVVSVEAENKEAAIEKAFSSSFGVEDIEQWDAHKQITQGNIFHGLQNEIEVIEEK